MLDFRAMSTPPATPARFTTQVRVRYAETDAAGVVYYGVYLTYFEVARVELLRALGHPIADVEGRGVLMPVVEARLKYLRPACLDELLDVTLWVESVGPASFGFEYEITRDGLLLVTGTHAARGRRARHGPCDADAGLAAGPV